MYIKPILFIFSYFRVGESTSTRRSGQCLFLPHAGFKTKGENERRSLFVFIAATEILGNQYI
ncbi:hypothetical protein CON94_09805 [Bacillus pseudomycoides]|nr:hypothetical protein CON94_09805 [Bacillus pseudomycoides]PEL87207.1 hypothetical protein CN615_13120 [Bacillus pseudomycoides]